jgi:hypothetical protein
MNGNPVGPPALAILLLALLPPQTSNAQNTPPSTQPTPTQPTTQPVLPLSAEIARAVDQAQKLIRAPKPKTKPARNSLETKDPPPANPIKQIAQGLTGKKGTITVSVLDVVRNDSSTIFTTAPVTVKENMTQYPFVVEAQFDNPTATYLTEGQNRDQQRNPSIATRNRKDSEEHKPTHKLWILCKDDEAIRQWTKGTRHQVTGEILTASLDSVPNDYIQARLVLKMDTLSAPPTTQPDQ